MEIFKIEPKAIAIEEGESSYLGDLAQELSKRFGVRILEVESNHARIVSSMLESNLDENMIGIVLRSGLESNSVFELNFYLASLSDSKIIGCFESLEGLFKINDDYSLKLELLAEVKDEFCKDLYPIEIRDLGDKFMILSEPILNGVIADTKRAVSQVRIAAKLYNSIVEGIYKMSLRLRRRLKINKLSLAGDMLENVFLLTNVYQKLKSKDFEVSISASVPFNDSGISLGQFVVVDNIIKEEIKNSSDS